jgi:hypothetical protein
VDRARDDTDGDPDRSPGRSSLIYCGLCGALNPASNHYCAACGTTLVDAFHATEGLRVYERPDSASRLVEIVPAGSELDIVEDAAAPADFVRVRLPRGRLGYIRLQEIEEGTAGAVVPTKLTRRPDINTNARGCVSTTGALASLALLVVTGALGLVLISRAAPSDVGVLSLVFCLAIVPLLLLTVGLYVAARSREDRLAQEEAEATEPGATGSD